MNRFPCHTLFHPCLFVVACLKVCAGMSLYPCTLHRPPECIEGFFVHLVLIFELVAFRAEYVETYCRPTPETA